MKKFFSRVNLRLEACQCVLYLIGSGIPLVKHLLWRSIARVREQMRFEPAGMSVSPDLQPSHNERESCLQSDAILATYSYKRDLNQSDTWRGKHFIVKRHSTKLFELHMMLLLTQIMTAFSKT